MHQIVVRPFGSEKKLTKKKLYDFVALICEVPKEDIEDVEIGEDEQGIIYVVTIRG